MAQYHDYEYEGDGLDPGLSEFIYDDSEYEADEFGERIGGDNFVDDLSEDEAAGDAAAADDGRLATDGEIEEGFGETLNPDTNPHLVEQLEDERLHHEAEADYTDPQSMAREEIPPLE